MEPTSPEVTRPTALRNSFGARNLIRVTSRRFRPHVTHTLLSRSGPCGTLNALSPEGHWLFLCHLGIYICLGPSLPKDLGRCAYTYVMQRVRRNSGPLGAAQFLESLWRACFVPDPLLPRTPGDTWQGTRVPLARHVHSVCLLWVLIMLPLYHPFFFLTDTQWLISFSQLILLD